MPTRTTRSTTSLSSLRRQSPISPLKNASGTAQAVRWVLNSPQRRKVRQVQERDPQRKSIRFTTPLYERRKHGQSPSLYSQILPSSPLLSSSSLPFSSLPLSSLPLSSLPLSSLPLFSVPSVPLCFPFFPVSHSSPFPFLPPCKPFGTHPNARKSADSPRVYPQASSLLP